MSNLTPYVPREWNYAEEIAHFLFGRLAIGSLLTPEQLHGDLREYLIRDLIDGLNEVAGHVDSMGYADIRELIEDAQWGRLHRRK